MECSWDFWDKILCCHENILTGVCCSRPQGLAGLLWELCHHTPLFPLFFLFIATPPVLSTTLNCIIMPHDYYNNTWHVLMVKIPCIGYNSWTWSINFKALRCQLTTIGDSGYRQHGMSTQSQRTSSTTNTSLPLWPSPWVVQWRYPYAYANTYMFIFSYAYPFIYYSPYVHTIRTDNFH